MWEPIDKIISTISSPFFKKKKIQSIHSDEIDIPANIHIQHSSGKRCNLITILPCSHACSSFMMPENGFGLMKRGMNQGRTLLKHLQHSSPNEAKRERVWDDLNLIFSFTASPQGTHHLILSWLVCYFPIVNLPWEGIGTGILNEVQSQNSYCFIGFRLLFLNVLELGPLSSVLDMTSHLSACTQSSLVGFIRTNLRQICSHHKHFIRS